MVTILCDAYVLFLRGLGGEHQRGVETTSHKNCRVLRGGVFKGRG